MGCPFSEQPSQGSAHGPAPFQGVSQAAHRDSLVIALLQPHWGCPRTCPAPALGLSRDHNQPLAVLPLGGFSPLQAILSLDWSHLSRAHVVHGTHATPSTSLLMQAQTPRQHHHPDRQPLNCCSTVVLGSASLCRCWAWQGHLSLSWKTHKHPRISLPLFQRSTVVRTGSPGPGGRCTLQGCCWHWLALTGGHFSRPQDVPARGRTRCLQPLRAREMSKGES